MKETAAGRQPGISKGSDSLVRKFSTFFGWIPLLVLACSVDEGPALGRPADPAIRFFLEAQERYVIGGPVEIRFTLENLSSGPLYVLKWYTPLEGLKGDIFRVTRDGVEIRYEGMMVKRADPRKEDYVRLGPRESVSAAVDLASTYDLSKEGRYFVEFTGRFHDVVREGEEVPRAMAKHTGVTVSGKGVSFVTGRR